jgi:hypothetical protein
MVWPERLEPNPTECLDPAPSPARRVVEGLG